ncbi:MAG: RNA-binding protein [Lachnospiraceae bacterium]|jgi:predicted RNA-binding protein (virulence factor B family)|nr:RNA-binding protein [Lachnospiraceae bacterium]
MIKLGEVQELEIVKVVEFGVYLAKPGADTKMKVLLPKKQVPPELTLGDSIEVFVYRDSDDRLIATVRRPFLLLGQVAVLRVVEVGRIGAFLDWGLEKDLLLPFREQTKRLHKEERILCALYIDKSERLCATMNVYPYLRQDSPYQKGDQVTGLIYETSEEFGAFVAVDHIYSALIPRQECYGRVVIGEEINARVSFVKEDGKLNLSIRDKAYLQMKKDTDTILTMLAQREGRFPFTDRAPAELISKETGMSRKEFKRAIGALLKSRQVEITQDAICLRNQTQHETAP